MTTKPEIIHSLDDAAKVLSGHIERYEERGRVIVAVGGPVGSGKSTLAQRLGGTVVSTDEYLPNYDEIEFAKRDEPSSADLDRLAQDLVTLRDAGRGDIPRWCFQEHRRIGYQSIEAEGVVVCEGLFALHPKLVDVVDVRVLVRAERAVRWGRWETIEQAGERGWGVERARGHFEQVADPTYEKHAHLYESELDYIVLNNTNDEARR